jgi:hypothetical protein
MYRSFADVKTADMLNLPVPKVHKHICTLKPTDEILRLNEVISERAEKINSGSVDPHIDNMLKITSDGKKLALDSRCFDERVLDNPDFKVNVCIENVLNIWRDTAEQRGTQVIFCDLSVPKISYTDYNPELDFDVYNHMKYRLTSNGVPENEIAFIHDAKTDVDKQTLFERVRSGDVRVLLGSTEKCGAGTNIQSRLYALHHLDTPYRPSDLEQREGRIIRQGNGNPEVHIYTYVTERTFDAYSYQILENKQRFISQINRGDLTVRVAADIDEETLTYAEIKAITSANPLIKRKHEVESELNQLRTLEGQYRRNKYTLQDKIAVHIPELIKNLENQINHLKNDITLRNNNTTNEFTITIAERTYADRKDAGELLQSLISSAANIDKKIATMNGFDIYSENSVFADERNVRLKGNGVYHVSVSNSAVGTITRLENFFKGLEDRQRACEEKLDTAKKELEAAKIEVMKPFDYESNIKILTDTLAGIDAELDLNKNEITPVIDDEKFKNEVQISNSEDDEKEQDDQNVEVNFAENTREVVEHSEKIERIEPLRVFKQDDNSVMVKISVDGHSTNVSIVWLPKNMIEINKDGFVVGATEGVISSKGLKPFFDTARQKHF